MLDVLVIPGWFIPTGPQLREISQRYSQHFGAMLRGHLRRGGLVAAQFNGCSLLAHCARKQWLGRQGLSVDDVPV